MKTGSGRGNQFTRLLSMLAIAGALAGILLRNWNQRTLPNRPVPIVSARPALPVLPARAPGVESLKREPPEFLGATDACVVEAPQIDDRFSIAAPVMDEAFVVAPLVRGRQSDVPVLRTPR